MARQAANDNSEFTGSVIFGDGNLDIWSQTKLETVCALADTSRGMIGKGRAAVYVVGPWDGSCVKIGKANSPANRLAQLQTGNPDPIFLHRVFWLSDMEKATAVEQRAHVFVGNHYRRLVGEWFECFPTKAHELVLKAISSFGWNYIAMTPCEPENIKHAAAA